MQQSDVGIGGCVGTIIPIVVARTIFGCDAAVNASHTQTRVPLAAIAGSVLDLCSRSFTHPDVAALALIDMTVP